MRVRETEREREREVKRVIELTTGDEGCGERERKKERKR